MGQRLNIEIMSGEKTLANAYYHWSAYTASAAELTKIILEEPVDETEPLVWQAIHLLEATGAGVPGYERDCIIKDEILPEDEISCLQPCIDRNRGLIAITEEGIRDTRCYEEGRVTIHLDSKTVDFNVFFRLDREEYEADYYGNVDMLPSFPVSTAAIPFEEFRDFHDWIVRNEDDWYYDPATACAIKAIA